MAPRIHVLINPGSGKPKTILAGYTFPRSFGQRDIEWEISLTRKKWRCGAVCPPGSREWGGYDRR